MSSLKIEYSYADGSANTVRRTGVTYPDGRQVTYDYGDSGSDADRLSRVAEVKVDGTAVTAYTYLGLSSVVESDNLVPQTRWNLITGSGADPYTALDRFGRAVDYPWQKYSSPTGTPARLEYGYDRASNRLWRQDDPARAASAGYDELYGYDTADRLTQVQRGTLNGGHTGITGQTLEQNWDLDPTGNWNEFDVDLPGSSNDLNQQRTQNAANEITDIEATTGPVWSTPSYDRAGNTTSFPLPGAEASAMSGVYDAWNRPVQWKLGSDSVARYAYDGLNRRTLSSDDRLSWDEFTLAQWAAFTLAQWQTFELNSQTEARHYYYSDAWQPLEERLGSAGTAQRQFVWGLRYIDDLILRDRDTTDSGSLDERLYALQDANWNVVALIDESAAVQQRVAYTPYGVPTFLDAGFAASTNSFDWETLFTGQRYDNPSGLYLYRMRFYHPQLGRFLQRDPIGYEGNIQNVYTYAAIQPIRMVDFNGLQCSPPTAVGSFIPGRGTITGYIGPDTDGDPDPELGSTAWLKFSWDKWPKDQNNCCCCTKIAWVQVIVYSKTVWHVFPTETHIDEVDKSIPYPKKSYLAPLFANPCNPGLGNPTAIAMTDTPYAPSRWGALLSNTQNYETCAVCLDGPEGPTMNGGRYTKMAVYGCIGWGQGVTWKPQLGRYSHTRWMDNKMTVAADADREITIPPGYIGDSPSNDWVTAVSNY